MSSGYVVTGNSINWVFQAYNSATVSVADSAVNAASSVNELASSISTSEVLASNAQSGLSSLSDVSIGDNLVGDITVTES